MIKTKTGFSVTDIFISTGVFFYYISNMIIIPKWRIKNWRFFLRLFNMNKRLQVISNV